MSDEIDENLNSQQFSIICYDVPEMLLGNGDTAVEHFGKFGNIAKIVLQPKKRSCIIEYNSREAVEKAVLNAGAYDGFMFDVIKKRRPKVNNDPEWLPDPEVAAELAALSRNNPQPPRLNRQQKMDIESSPILPRKKPALKKITQKNIERKRTKSITKSENKPVKTTKIVKIDNDEIRQLLNKQWITIEEKLVALELRNKLLRVNLPKREGALKGCCPDMCAERERLLRQSQRQIASFETSESDPNRFDPKKAVKEYSRSSADQEEPLAHDLRPEPVLHMTLLYLLYYISDLCDDLETSLSDWFHFMWDRLRAIRKDITQQALCCEGSVLLVEACARFHAHCAARLTEEPPSSFDQQLNTENLLKCLQSLKYMYDDLRLRNDSGACKNEAEFRAYVILLNMQDSNFMWEVQQLSPEVQSSKEVKFAINIFTALDNNNYVKFFQLVRQTTYLNACILFRYFTYVRANALMRLVKAYSPRGASYFPASDLMDMLAFESLESMEYFLNHYGLQMSADQNGQYVILDRNANQNNTMQYMQERAFNLVESKRKCPLGETIYGASLPRYNFNNYKLHSSFDANNYFKQESILAEDQGNAPPADVVVGIRKIIDNINKPDNQITNLKVKPDLSEVQKPAPMTSFVFAEPKKTTNAANLFKSAIETMPFENVKSSAFIVPQNNFIFSKPDIAPPLFQLNQGSSVNIFGKPTVDLVPENKNIFSSVASDLFSSSAPKKSNAFEMQSNNVFGGNLIKDANPFLKKELPKTNIFENINLKIPAFDNKKFEDERIRIENENKKKEEERQLEELKKEELRKEELKRQEIQKKVEREKEEAEKVKRKEEMEKLEKEKKIKEFEELIEKQSNRIMSNIVEDFVNEICIASIKDELDRLDEIKKEAQEICNEVIIDICEEECRKRIMIARRLSEIRFQILARSVIKKWKSTVVKSRRRHLLLVNTPSWMPTQPPPIASTSQTAALERMRNFHRGRVTDLKVPDNRRVDKIDVIDVVKKNLFNYSRDINKNSFSINIFWKVAVSTPNKNESDCNYYNMFINDALSDAETINDDGLIYLKETYCFKKIHVSICKSDSKSNIGANGMIFYGNNDQCDILLKRIRDSINKKSEYQQFPIALILLGREELTIIKKELMDYKINGTISSFKIIIINRIADVIVSMATKEALNWLSKNISQKPPLELNHLHLYLDQCIGKELWYRFKTALHSPIREAFKDIKIVTKLYNEAVDKAIKIACNDNLHKYPIFPPEFERYLTSNFIYPKEYEYAPKNWMSNIHMIENLIKSFKVIDYNSEWPPNDWESFQMSIKSFIDRLSWFKNNDKIFLKILSVFMVNNDEINELRIESSSWLNIMEVLVEEKINSCNAANESLKVVYNRRDLDYYRTTPWWYRSTVIRDICPFIEEIDSNFLDDTIEDLGISSSKRAKLDSTVDSIPDEEWVSAVMSDLDKSYQQRSACNEILDELEKSIEMESTRQAQIEEYLKSVLNEK